MINTSYLPLRLQAIKLIYRWYYMPVKLQRITKSTSGLCWKGCGRAADYIHCLWGCLQIRCFWKQICNVLYTVTGYCLPEWPETILLNAWEDNVPLLTCYICSTLLTLAKLEVASKWKVAKQPSING